MLSILGIVVIIVATYQVYKAAKDTGRNAVVWGLVTFVVGVGIQIGIPIIAGIILAIVWMSSGTSVPKIQEAMAAPSLVIGLVCLALSLVAVWIILRQVSKIPEERAFVSPPAPPTNFN